MQSIAVVKLIFYRLVDFDKPKPNNNEPKLKIQYLADTGFFIMY
ncbi:hypothetical protein VAEU17_3190008 [Vibrio aestuarianus]|nr:hypothetical protein VAEU17_3190008 [Vibrio aestuarianus]